MDPSQLARAIQAGSLPLQLCDVASFVEADVVMPPSKERSASDALVVLGHLRFRLRKDGQGQGQEQASGEGLALKISFAPRETPSPRKGVSVLNSLEYEALFYKKVVNPLVLRRRTPNLIMYYGSVSCPNVGDTADPQMRKALQETISYVKARDSDQYDFDVLTVLLLERGSGLSLRDADLESMPPDATFSILAQILYTLVCFGQVGVRHNDLHQGNIWIGPTQETEIVYRVGQTTCLRVPTFGIMVKIYDFDRASVDTPSGLLGPTANEALDYICEDTGACNFSRNSKYDAFTVLSEMSLRTYTKMDVPQEVDEWIASTVGFNEQLGYSSTLCEPREDGPCDPVGEPDDAVWPATMDLLMSLCDRRGWTQAGGKPPTKAYSLPFLDP